MRAFVAGATGVVGRRIVRGLASRGHEVLGLARTPERDALIRELGGTPVRADLFDADSLARAAPGAEVFIRAATSIPTKVRTRPRDWAMNDRIRTDGTLAMTAAASAVGARAYVHESIVWVAGSSDGTPFDEDAPPRVLPYLRSTLEGERIAREAGERTGIAAAILRCGLFYAADAAHIRSFGERLARGRMPTVRGGRAVWSLIHADDAASAFVAAAQGAKPGLWHVVDDRPVAQVDLFRGLARRLGGPPPRDVPVWLVRLAAGRFAAQSLTTSFPTSNARLRRDFPWRPRYPTFEEGLDQVVEAWKAEGFPPRAR